jgi:uncharacterized protein YjbI with pentapeptide repeats
MHGSITQSFERARCVAARFNYAKLSSLKFLHANAKGALFNHTEFINVNFSLANLHNA